MRLEIDIPEHHYNNIMAIDSISLGRMPYKGIIMYAINAIKQGKVLEQEPTPKNDLRVDCISRADVLKLMQDNWHTHNGDWAMQESMDDIRALPPVTPREPKTGHWIDIAVYFAGVHRDIDYVECSCCHYESLEKGNYCPNCGAKMEGGRQWE